MGTGSSCAFVGGVGASTNMEVGGLETDAVGLK